MTSWLTRFKPNWQLNRTLIFTHTLTLMLGGFIGYETYRSIGLFVLLAKLGLIGGAGYTGFWIWAQASSRFDRFRSNWSGTPQLTTKQEDADAQN